MKAVVIAALLVSSILSAAQMGSQNTRDSITIHATFAEQPASDCTIEIQDRTSSATLQTQFCNPNGVDFQVSQGDYVIVIEQGSQRVQQPVATESPFVHVSLALPPAREKGTNPTSSVISVRELSVPQKAQSLVDKASHLLEQGKLDQANQQVAKSLEIAPQYAKAYAVRAEINMMGQQGAQALEAADQAVKLDPQFPYAHFVRASVLNSLARFNEARSAAEQGLRLDTNSWQGHFELAEALGGLNNLPDALREATHAESIAPPQFLPLRMLRAYLLIRFRAVDDAASEMKELRAKAGKDPRVIRLQAMFTQLVALRSQPQVARNSPQ